MLLLLLLFGLKIWPFSQKTCLQLTLRQSQWPGVFWPPPWLGENPPRNHVTGTSPARGPCQHRTFKQAQTTKQTQSITKLFSTQIDKSNWGEGVRARNHPPPPAFDSWPPASHQQIAHALGHPPEPGLTEPPLGLESPARSGFGLRPNPVEKLGARSCEHG